MNTIPFLVTVSRDLKFVMAMRLWNRTAGVILTAMVKVVKLYLNRGFKINVAYMDNEFAPLELEIPGMTVNCYAANEHVPEAERVIRVIKERVRAVFCTMPFKKIPALMLVELIRFSIMWLNVFPAAQGVSQTLGPRQLLVGTKLDWNLHC